MKGWLKKVWETVGIGLITVAVVGMVGWWGSYQGTKSTINHLCENVSEITKSVKSLHSKMGEQKAEMVGIKTQLNGSNQFRAEILGEISEIKKDLRRMDKAFDRHVDRYHSDRGAR